MQNAFKCLISGFKRDNLLKLNKSRKNFYYDSTKNHKPKPVFQCDKTTGKVITKFGSAKIASKITGINMANIHNCCNGRIRNTGGYTWRY